MSKDKNTCEHLFVADCGFAESIGHYIIDILNEYHGRVHVAEILDKRAVTAGTENKVAVVIAEGLIVECGCDCVGRRLLLRYRDVIFDTKTVFHRFYCFGDLLLKEFVMIGRYGEMQIHLAMSGSCLGTFGKMLLKWCAGAPVRIFVECQKGLGQIAVVHAFFRYDGIDDFLLPAGLKQSLGWHAVKTDCGVV